MDNKEIVIRLKAIRNCISIQNDIFTSQDVEAISDAIAKYNDDDCDSDQ